jgi:hypothetical protein
VDNHHLGIVGELAGAKLSVGGREKIFHYTVALADNLRRQTLNRHAQGITYSKA